MTKLPSHHGSVYTIQFKPPSLPKRLISMLYEALLVLALFFLATFIFIAIVGDATSYPKKFFLQLFLWLIAGVYFVYHWHKGGTLAMQTWRIQLVSISHQAVSLKQAIMRYIFASLFFGVGFLWALFDRENLSLHDRLVGTRLHQNEK